MTDSLKDLLISEQIENIRSELRYFTKQDKNVVNHILFESIFSNPNQTIGEKRQMILDYISDAEQFKQKYNLVNDVKDGELLDPSTDLPLEQCFIYDSCAYNYSSIIGLSQQIQLSEEVSNWIVGYQSVIYLIVENSKSFEDISFYTQKSEVYLNNVFAPSVYLNCTKPCKVFIDNEACRMAPIFTVDGSCEYLSFSNTWLCNLRLPNKIPIVEISSTVLNSLEIDELPEILTFSDVEFDNVNSSNSTKLYTMLTNFTKKLSRDYDCEKLTISDCTFRSNLCFDDCKIREIDISFSKTTQSIDLSRIKSSKITLENKTQNGIEIYMSSSDKKSVVDELILKGNFFFKYAPKARIIRTDNGFILSSLYDVKYKGTLIYGDETIEMD